MTTPETHDATSITEVQTAYEVTGLYIFRNPPYRLHATNEADARRQFHTLFPGLEGTTFKVSKVTEDDKDDNDDT